MHASHELHAWNLVNSRDGDRELRVMESDGNRSHLLVDLISTSIFGPLAQLVRAVGS